MARRISDQYPDSLRPQVQEVIIVTRHMIVRVMGDREIEGRQHRQHTGHQLLLQTSRLLERGAHPQMLLCQFRGTIIHEAL